jgi:hypothetical protein
MTGINWNAKQVHKDLILAMLMHHMSQETRQMLMLECPAAYNDLCGGDYVRVHRVSDGDPIVPGVLRKTVVRFNGDEMPFPWCDSCLSYHHPENPTCKLVDPAYTHPGVEG